MKKEIKLIVVGLLALITLALYPPQIVIAKEVKAEEIIRLHVIANSDEDKDQELKLKVRDEIVTALRPNLIKAKDRDQAEEILRENLPRLEKIAEKKVLSEGFSYPVKAVIGDFNFPVKAYNDFIAPAGTYRALKVIIGEGAGANWWCVMFPPICFVDLKHQVTVEPSLTEEKQLQEPEPVNEVEHEDSDEASEEKAEIEVRFKIVELWNSLTNKISSLF